MGTRQPENTRSIAIAAHGGAGKTSLVEAMLFDNGSTTRLGKVVDGNTASDFSQEEQKRQISINTSLVTMERNGRQFFVLDTPGFADFIGEMRSAVRVADALLIAVSGVSGIEVQTDKAWETGSEFELPTAFYVSKLDRENSISKSARGAQVSLQRQGSGRFPARGIRGIIQWCGGYP